MNWGDLQNGALLRTAQADFDVPITTDSNIEYQQVVPNYDIALIVLRAFRTSLKYLAPLAPQVLAALETIEAGQVLYIYADQKLAAKDQAKGQK